MPQDFGMTSAHQAALNNSDNFLKIIKKNPELAESSSAWLGNSPLFCATGSNNLSAIEWYLKERPGDFLVDNGLGYSPLQWAIETGVLQNHSAIMVMLDHMQDFSNVDNLGNNVIHTLLHCLQWQDETAVLDILAQISQQAPDLLDIANYDGETPIQRAKALSVFSQALSATLKPLNRAT